MRNQGVVLALMSLMGCAGQTVDLGPADGGSRPQSSTDTEGGSARSGAPSGIAYNAAVTENARLACSPSSIGAAATTTYTAADLQTKLAGGWLLCGYQDIRDAISYVFTADGHWAVLTDDGHGGMVQAQQGVWDSGAPAEGTFVLMDQDGHLAGGGAPITYVGRNGNAWFHPEFATGSTDRMTLFVTTGTEETYARLGP